MKVMHWFVSKPKKVDMRKTRLMCFRNSLKSAQINVSFTLHLCNPLTLWLYKSKYVNSTNHLGINFDSDLYCNTHKSYPSGRLRSVYYLYHIVKVCFSFYIWMMLANILAYSTYRYGITTLRGSSNFLKTKIDSILKNTLKMFFITFRFHRPKIHCMTWNFPAFSKMCPWDKNCTVSFKIPCSSESSLRGNETFIATRVFRNYGKCMKIFLFTSDIYRASKKIH